MALMDLIVLLIVAGIVGSIGQALVGVSRGGCLVSIALGFIGAMIGPWIARYVGLSDIFILKIGDTRFPIVWSIIGSTLFVAVVALLGRGRR